MTGITREMYAYQITLTTEEFDIMNTETFNKVIREQIERCEATLCKKADEYATDDMLHNFKVAAGIQNCLPTTALGGMMAKHTVSVYDMIRGLEEGKSYPIELWNEKITDSINYLLLLLAAVREDSENQRNHQNYVLIFAENDESFMDFKERIIKLAFKYKRDIHGVWGRRTYDATYFLSDNRVSFNREWFGDEY